MNWRICKMETMALIIASVAVISMFVYMLKEFGGNAKKKVHN